jgi:two-component system nitrogen regulation response regulator NtrX
VLITGPAGVGKEVAARLLHNWSARAKAPFIVVSAARMTPERVEEELFGVEAGELARPGLLEQAHGGTLFLDEIADMPPPAQAKILRVLTDQSFTRVGGQRVVKWTCAWSPRPRASCRRRLPRAASARILFYRLNVVPVHLPALSERREDIPSLPPTSPRASRPSSASPAPISRETRSRLSRPMTGLEMSASSGT